MIRLLTEIFEIFGVPSCINYPLESLYLSLVIALKSIEKIAEALFLYFVKTNVYVKLGGY